MPFCSSITTYEKAFSVRNVVLMLHILLVILFCAGSKNQGKSNAAINVINLRGFHCFFMAINPAHHIPVNPYTMYAKCRVQN